MNDILSLIGRDSDLFKKDIDLNRSDLTEIISKSSFLIIGGAGSIGQALTYEVLSRNPKLIHIVDINENNLVELVRGFRSSIGKIDGEFKTFAIDCGSILFKSFMDAHGPYDYILNLSALKHVRSEKDPFTLMRMVDVNILNPINILADIKPNTLKKFFCVSTDKATNPVSMMGASKRIMELFLLRESANHSMSTARFANVAFSDGSLLHGFTNRLQKKQPISAPKDILRYFITPKESGELCLMSSIFGKNRDIFFPKLSDSLHLISFSDIAKKFLIHNGYEPFECESEEQARNESKSLISNKKWPCYFFNSDTSGEKDFEEFYVKGDKVEMNRFEGIGILNQPNENKIDLRNFIDEVSKLKNSGHWSKNELVKLFNEIIPEFSHLETGKNLDQKM